MDIKGNRKSYRADYTFPCCWNCKHSFQRMGLTLLCRNPEEWIKEASVEPIGKCDSYEAKNAYKAD